MTVQNREVDFRKWFLWREGDVENTEERDEARVHFIATTTRLKIGFKTK